MYVLYSYIYHIYKLSVGNYDTFHFNSKFQLLIDDAMEILQRGFEFLKGILYHILYISRSAIF